VCTWAAQAVSGLPAGAQRAVRGGLLACAHPPARPVCRSPQVAMSTPFSNGNEKDQKSAAQPVPQMDKPTAHQHEDPSPDLYRQAAAAAAAAAIPSQACSQRPCLPLPLLLQDLLSHRGGLPELHNIL
jgi:hypothetical protein